MQLYASARPSAPVRWPPTSACSPGSCSGCWSRASSTARCSCWPSPAGRSRTWPARSPGTWSRRRASPRTCPLVGDELSAPFGALADAGGSVSGAGQAAQDAVGTLSTVLAVVLVVLPVGWLLLRWLPWRLRWAREAAAARTLLAGTPDLHAARRPGAGHRAAPPAGRPPARAREPPGRPATRPRSARSPAWSSTGWACGCRPAPGPACPPGDGPLAGVPRAQPGRRRCAPAPRPAPRRRPRSCGCRRRTPAGRRRRAAPARPSCPPPRARRRSPRAGRPSDSSSAR